MAYLDNTITKDNIRLSCLLVHYLLCPKNTIGLYRPMILLLPISGTISFLYNAMDHLKDTAAKTWLEANDHRLDKNGRGVWLQVKRIGEGNDNSERIIKGLQHQLNAMRYLGIGTCNAKKTTNWLINFYQRLSEEGIVYDGLQKLRYLKNNYNIQDDKMERDYWVGDWLKDARTAINEGCYNGTPINFMNWTTSLINGEKEYFDAIAKKKHTISSASRGPPSECSFDQIDAALSVLENNMHSPNDTIKDIFSWTQNHLVHSGWWWLRI